MADISKITLPDGQSYNIKDPNAVTSVNGKTGDVILTAADVSAAISNLNLLDNPWFQINQRGLTSLNASGYFMDRWMSSNSNCRFSVSNNIVTLSASGGDAYFRQKFENILEVGRTYTISAYIKGNVAGYIGIVDSAYQYVTGKTFSTSYSDWTIVSHTFTVSNSDCAMITLRCNNGSTYQVKAVKMEIGTSSTLQNDTSPNYSYDFIRCARFFYRLKASSSYVLDLGVFGAASTTTIRVVTLLPIPMRTYPTISVSGTNALTAIGTNGTQVNSTAIAGYVYSTDYRIRTFYGTFSGLKNNEFYRIQLKTGTYIDFNADL